MREAEFVVPSLHAHSMTARKVQLASHLVAVYYIVRLGTTYIVVISQHVGQLRGRIEGFCALHLKLRDFFALLLLKPKSDRISLRGGMVNSRSVKEFDMTSFDLLLVGNN
jgi:hypothetical protein